jgi:hypothetical protein
MRRKNARARAESAARGLDSRLGLAGLVRATMNKVFPEQRCRPSIPTCGHCLSGGRDRVDEVTDGAVGQCAGDVGDSDDADQVVAIDHG